MATVGRRTIGDYWTSAGGRPAGFDNLRVILALGVILWHSIEICYGPAPGQWFWVGPLRPVVCYIVPGFFALSGFLVAGSLLRNDVLSFASLRVIRIYPALAFEVLLSAFFIGLFVTTVSMRTYFTSHRFLAYLLNMTGWVHFYLPGVFNDNPAGNRVNFQLWTVPYELKCYVLLTFLALVKLHRKPAVFLMLAFAINIAMLPYIYFFNDMPRMSGGLPGSVLIFSFIFGVAFFLAKDWLLINIWIFIIAITAYALLVYNSYGVYACTPFLVYMTVLIGVQNRRLPGIAFLSNYSYGIYLYGFVVQQFFAFLLPNYRIWWLNFIMSSIASIAIAAVSWHFIEKPIDRNKKTIVKQISNIRDKITSRLPTFFSVKSVDGLPIQERTASNFEPLN